MAFPLITAANAIAAGFAKIGARNTLYVHPNYPGLLFRLVESEAEAITIGGIGLFHPANGSSILYFGLDAAAAHAVGKLGYARVPTSVSIKPDADVTGATTYVSAEVKYSNCGRVVEPTVHVEENFGAGMLMIGLISRADRGFIRILPAALSGRALACARIPALSLGQADWGSGTAANVSLGTYAANRIDGYVDMNWVIERKPFLQMAKPRFLASLSGEDSAIVDAYDTAFDQLIAESSGTVIDRVRLWAYDAAGAVHFSVYRLPPISPSHPEGDGFTKREPAPGATNSSAPVRTATTRWLGLEVGYDKGIDCPRLGGYYQSQQSSTVVNLIHPAPPSVFSLDAVPYAKVKMAASFTLPISGVIAPIGPRVGPAAVVDPLSVLDVSDRVESNLSLLSLAKPGFSVPAGAPEAAQTTLVANGRGQESIRRSTVMRYARYFDPMTRFVVESTNRLDKLVDDQLN